MLKTSYFKKYIIRDLKSKILIGLLFYIISLFIFNQQAFSAQPNALQNNNCFSCHAQQQNLMGPSWQSIRARYQSKAGSKDVISKSIIHGVSGKWGEIPMPSNPQLSQAEADAISQWILGGK